MSRSLLLAATLAAAQFGLINTLLADEPVSPTQLLSQRGLTKIGSVYELEVDAHLNDRLRAIRAAQSQLTSYARQHEAIQNDVSHTTSTLDDLAQQLVEVDRKTEKVDKSAYATYNFLINQHNEIVTQMHQGQSYLQQRTDDLGKLVTPPSTLGLTLSLASDIDAADTQYATLAADPDVKKSLDALNAKGPHVTLGPSASFTEQRQTIRHQRDQAMKAGIKGKLYHNTLQVAATLNKFDLPMIVDSGCSAILITYDVAKKAGIHIDPAGPTVKATIANGTIVTVRSTKIATLTVGQYTLKDVPCDVLPAGTGEDCLLGGSFLQHFLYQIDLNAAVLNLSPLDASSGKTANSPTTRQSPGATTAGSTRAGEKPADDPAALQALLSGTTWQWNADETVEFQSDGSAMNSGWTSQGLVTTWKAIDRRTVLLFIKSGRSSDRYAVLSFNSDSTAYSVYDFRGQLPSMENRRISRP